MSKRTSGLLGAALLLLGGWYVARANQRQVSNNQNTAVSGRSTGEAEVLAENLRNAWADHHTMAAVKTTNAATA